MNEYQFTWQCNNGYSCGCCGKWWEDVEVMDFNTDQDAVKFGKENTHDERELESIYLIIREKIDHE